MSEPTDVKKQMSKLIQDLSDATETLAFLESENSMLHELTSRLNKGERRVPEPPRSMAEKYEELKQLLILRRDQIQHLSMCNDKMRRRIFDEWH